MKKNDILHEVARNFLKLGIQIDGGRFVLGVSGGADSVALALIMAKLAEKQQLKLFILHVNHGIRKDAADKDADFCKNLAEKFCLPFFCEKISPLSASEDFLRKSRYKIFSDFADKLDADVLLAHNLNDNAETVFFNLIRGTDVKGLAGIPAIRSLGAKHIIRPLLSVSRRRILDFLAGENQDFCTDESNKNINYSRNFIRNNIISPIISNFGEESLVRLYNTSHNMNEIYDFLCEAAKEIVQDLPFSIKLIRKDANTKPVVLFRAIHDAAVSFNISASQLGRSAIENIIALPNGESIQLAAKIFATNHRGQIFIYDESLLPEIPEKIGIQTGTNSILPYGEINLERIDRPDSGHLGDGIFYAVFSIFSGEKMSIRNPATGENFVPFGSAEKNFTQFARDKGFPKFLRNRIPLLCADDSSVWAIGAGISDSFRIADGQNKEIYSAKFSGDWVNLVDILRVTFVVTT